MDEIDLVDPIDAGRGILMTNETQYKTSSPPQFLDIAKLLNR